MVGCVLIVLGCEFSMAIKMLRMKAPDWVTAALACGWAGTAPGQLVLIPLTLLAVMDAPNATSRIGYFVTAIIYILALQLCLFVVATFGAMILLLIARTTVPRCFKRTSLEAKAATAGGFLGAFGPVLFLLILGGELESFMPFMLIAFLAGWALPLLVLSLAGRNRVPIR